MSIDKNSLIKIIEDEYNLQLQEDVRDEYFSAKKDVTAAQNDVKDEEGSDKLKGLITVEKKKRDPFKNS